MKKRIVAVVAIALMLAGCSSKVKGDKTLVCMLSSSYEEETFFGYIEVDYDSESMKAEKANYSYSYDNLQKNEANNQVLIDLVNRNSVYVEIEGVEATLDIKDFSFGYAEAWDYNELDYDAAREVDDVQKHLMDEDSYNAQKIYDFYVAQGFSCDMNGKKQDLQDKNKEKDTKKKTDKETNKETEKKN